jgi:DNA polymerase III subunit alpha
MNACDFHVHSGYSTWDGFSSPKSVVARAVELGWGAVSLTEHGWLGSAPALYAEAKKAGIKPILGCEMYVTPEDFLIDGDKTVLKERRHLTVLALSTEGYHNLVSWVSASMQRPLYYNGPRISIDRMIESAPHGLHHNVILSGCMGGELCQCLTHSNGAGDYAGAAYLESMASVFPNFYVELQNHAADKFMGQGFTHYEDFVEEQSAVRERLLHLAATLNLPVVLTNDSHYQAPGQRRAHLAMLARKDHRKAADYRAASSASQAEGYASQYGYWTNYMQDMERLAETLPPWAAKESIQSIHDIVAEADVKLDPLDQFSYALPRSPYRDTVKEIRRRSQPRLKALTAKYGKAAQERFDYELEAMAQFGHYLLIYADIIRLCRSAGIYTWTRGSAANSLVNFCLRIHEIDPIHYKLMFERFVNPASAKFPDVDIDIEAHRREDVVKMVTEYMAELGQEVIPICTHSTLQNRAAFRLIAEAHGVPEEKIAEYTKLLPQQSDSDAVAEDEDAYERLLAELGIDIHEEAGQVFDSIGGVSQHACALAIGTADRRLAEWVPMYRIGSSNALVTQYNMKWIEEMGFLKLDLLKLDTLSIMHNIARQLGKDMDWLDGIMASEPGIYDDPDAATYKLLRAGRTEGVHTFQGATQRRGLIEVAPESDHELVAVNALYRPSGTRTGLDKDFVNRKHGREDWQSTNAMVGSYLDETFGIAIYQEQIMEMGKGMGMTGEEIDQLYKAIKTAKGAGRGARELFEAFEPVYRQYADKLWPQGEADEIWGEWEKLQGYTFNRGHATSYSILGMKNAYLAAHEAQSFFVSVLDRYPKNPRYLAAAIAAGFTFEPPDVNTSAGGFTRGSTAKSIRVGLLRVMGLGPGATGEIVRNQPFNSLDDLIERTHSGRVDITVRTNLGSVGALESLGIAGEDSDETEFEVLGFCLGMPRAMRDLKPMLRGREGGKWKFHGLQHGVDITEGKSFCAKLFWIPEKINFSTKSSATGAYNAHLLTVVDENGIPFDLRVPEDKYIESKLIHTLAESPGTVITAEGQVAMPFIRGANTGFKLWGIAGAEDNNPQMWHCETATAKKVTQYARDKATTRRTA